MAGPEISKSSPHDVFFCGFSSSYAKEPYFNLSHFGSSLTVATSRPLAQDIAFTCKSNGSSSTSSREGQNNDRLCLSQDTSLSAFDCYRARDRQHTVRQWIAMKTRYGKCRCGFIMSHALSLTPEGISMLEDTPPQSNGIIVFARSDRFST